jgi:predicted dehydrogenase
VPGLEPGSTKFLGGSGESKQSAYRVGFVGAGGIAPEHADALGMLECAEIVSVCDLQEQRAQAFSKKFNIPHAYSSVQEMLAHEQLDVVHMLTQPQHHLNPAFACLRAGVNVYIEKPLSRSTSDCRLLADEALKYGRLAGVNHHLTHSRLIDEIVQATRNRRLGRINHVSVAFCAGAGKLPTREVNHFMFSTPSAILFEYCPHSFSLIRRFLGRAIEVTALASDSKRLSNGNKYYCSWEIAAIAERGTAQLYFSAGQGNDEISISVYGQDASAHADIKRGTLIFHENSPYPITAHLRDSLNNAKRLQKQGISRFLNDYMVKLKLRPARLTNSFYPALANYYSAPRAGNSFSEDALAGHDVVAYCELAAANMKIVD